MSTAKDQIPARNLRVPRAEFVALWTAAESQNSRLFDDGRPPSWYVPGIVVTCQWLACTSRDAPGGRYQQARSPVGDRELRATEDSIESEYQAAELMAERQPWLLEQRPGWCEGIRATLRWAWRNEGPPPLDENEEPTAWSTPRT